MSDKINRLIQEANIDKERAARLLEEMAVMETQITTLRGAMKADDERLRAAGERVGIFADCDTAEMMADEITRLRAALADERKRALEEAGECGCMAASIGKGSGE